MGQLLLSAFHSNSQLSGNSLRVAGLGKVSPECEEWQAQTLLLLTGFFCKSEQHKIGNKYISRCGVTYDVFVSISAVDYLPSARTCPDGPPTLSGKSHPRSYYHERKQWFCVKWKLPLGSPGHIAISQRAEPRLPELQGGGDATPFNPLLPTPRD